MLSLWRSTSRDPGWQQVSSGRVPGKSGRCRMANSGRLRSRADCLVPAPLSGLSAATETHSSTLLLPKSYASIRRPAGAPESLSPTRTAIDSPPVGALELDHGREDQIARAALASPRIALHVMPDQAVRLRQTPAAV